MRTDADDLARVRDPAVERLLNHTAIVAEFLSSTVAAVRRKLAAAVLAVVAVVAVGACSTPVYTTDTAVHDLERQSHLTHTQAECIVRAIRKHFETAIEATQKTNKLTALPADQLKLEVDGALAAIRAPSRTETDVARRAIADCAPGALQ